MGDITTAMKNTYQMNFTLLEQQMGSKLQSLVRRETIDGEYKYFDFIDAADATEVFTRNADTVNEDLVYARRRISLRRFTFAPLIDTFDKLALINDPTSDIVMDALHAMGRQKDLLITEAAVGTTYGGYDGTTSYTFDTSNNRVAVTVRDSGSGATGMNVAKLRGAKKILDGHNVDTNIPRHIAITAEQMEELLASTEIGSYDYNSVKALVQGDFSTFMGFKFVEVNGEVASTGIIPVTADPYRRVLAWAEDGIILGVGKDVKTNIEQRIDKNYSYQIFNEMWMGSMRTSEKKVVDVLCDES
jgi:hypothetical protein